MKRNLIRVTLGVAALAVVLVGLESQAEAGRRHCGRRHHCRHDRQSCCETKCEPACEAKPACECEAAPACESDCGCDNGCRKHRFRHRCRNNGCDSGCGNGCNGGCNGGCGGEVIHESAPVEKTESAPAPPADAPAEGEAPSA
ncbi:MAG: hypothetical protein L0228_14215 [Planctomycetes bacterium]|nr:hypothetical protein [Planctomycetota bacterium]